MSDSRPYPYGIPRVPAPPELFESSKRLRQTRFDSWLLDTAAPKLEKYAAALAATGKMGVVDEIYCLWSICLQAEIYDYFAKPEEAERVLRKVGGDLRKELREDEDLCFRDLLGPGEAAEALMRQRLWTLVFYAHSWYRLPDLKTAEEILVASREALEKRLRRKTALKPPAPSYGLQARIAYSLGQVYRQSGNVKSARAQFVKAIELTGKRLDVKTKKYRERGDAETQFQEQRYASYIVGKALSFGIAWAGFNTGELERARGTAAAGVTLLEICEDRVHHAYANVVYAQILRATTRPVTDGAEPSPELLEAETILRDLVDEKTSPLRVVPRFLSRARYEYARVQDLLGKYKEAETRAKQLYLAQREGDRWWIACGIFLCRLLLKQDCVAEARAYADEIERGALKLKSTVAPLRAEILLNRASVMMQQDDADFKAVDDAISEAEQLWRGNPLSTAVCYLQRARNHALHQEIEHAREFMAKWDACSSTIEHGAVLDLADRTRAQLSDLNPDFSACPADLKNLGLMRFTEGSGGGRCCGVMSWSLQRIARSKPTNT